MLTLPQWGTPWGFTGCLSKGCLRGGTGCGLVLGDLGAGGFKEAGSFAVDTVRNQGESVSDYLNKPYVYRRQEE